MSQINEHGEPEEYKGCKIFLADWREASLYKTQHELPNIAVSFRLLLADKIKKAIEEYELKLDTEAS